MACLELSQDLIGVLRKCPMLALDRLQVGGGCRPALTMSVALASMGASAHQGVLEDRKGILFLASSEQEAVADCGVDLAAVKRGGLVNGAQKAEVVQPRE